MPRILYLDIDSLRPDHLGCYGYPRPTSPVIDTIARQGTRFTNVHASAAPCLPSRAALFTGTFGIRNGITCHNGPASILRYPGSDHFHDPTRPLWMRYLQHQGWETVCYSGFAQRRLAWWFSAGFTQNFGNQLPGALESAEMVSRKVIHWLRTNGRQDNWFMHVNFWDVHHPYRAPQEFFNRVRSYPGPPYPNADTIAEHLQTWYGPRTARDWWSSYPDFRNPNDPYTQRMPPGNIDDIEAFMCFNNGHDAGLAYADEKIGEILAELERLGILEETAIIVSRDHGESIGELGMYFEHGNCCEGTTHIPLIIRWPGLTDRESVYDGLMYNLDLPPTVLDLLGLPVPPGWDGTSYKAALSGGVVRPRSHLILGAGIYSFQRAVRTPEYRLIRTIHPGLYPYDDLYLFDMRNDPNQTTNLALERPTVVAELDHLLLDWLWRHTTGPAGVSDPFQEQLKAGFDPDLYCLRARMEHRLVDLGRLDQIADLRRRRDTKP